MPLCRLALLALLASAGCSLDLLVVRAEVEELCIVDLEVEFPAAPDGSMISDVLEEDALRLHLGDDVSARLEVIGIGVWVTDPADRPAILDHARVALGAEGLPEVVVAEHAGALASEGFYLDSDAGVDLAAYLRAPRAALTLGLQGELPDRPWQATVDVCLAGELGYRQGL